MVTTIRYGLGISRPPFGTFNLGSRCGDDPDAVAANRGALNDALALPSPPCWLKQVHGIGVVRLGGGPARLSESAQPSNCHPERSERSVVALPGQRESGSLAALGMTGKSAVEEEPEADAAVTSTSGTVLAILTADCLPVVFSARDGSEIGAAHAGWRGLAAGVLEATVAAMVTRTDQLIVWLGPAAGPNAYEIGAEVRDAFIAHDAAAAAAFTATRPDHWRVDLYALARQRLMAAGISAEAIHGGAHCTISEADTFFSHRRDGRSGRIATLVWRQPAAA